jgi:hypothetical protein
MSVVFYAIVERSGWQMQSRREEIGVENFRSGGVFVLGEAVANVGGNALLNYVAEEARERGCDCDQEPEKGREGKAYDGYGFKRDGDDVGLVDVEAYCADMGDDFEPVNDDRGEQEGGDGEGADRDEKDVDGARNLLATTAMGAVGQVLVVVLTHSW